MRAGCRRRAPVVSLCLELRAAPLPPFPGSTSPARVTSAPPSAPALAKTSLLIILIATKAVLHPRSLRHLSL